MPAVGRLPSPHLESPLGPHNFEVAAVESDAEDVVEIRSDGDTTEKKVPARSFDLQSYTAGEAWLTIFQVDDVKNLLRAIYQTEESRLMGSSGSNKYQYGVRLRNMASPAHRKFGFVSFDSMLEQGGKDRFFKINSSLTILGGRHGLSCI